MLSATTLRPQDLWKAVLGRAASALAAGALHPIETTQSYLADGGVEFLVRRVSSLQRKAAVPARENPFFPYEEALFVGNLSESHCLLLNKFNVIDHHILIVTRHYEEQLSQLSSDDFRALSICLAAVDGLCFYNGGAAAGASQPHKHLQLVPLPLCERGPGVPIESLLDAVCSGARIRNVPGVAFSHAVARLDPKTSEDPARSAEITYELYLSLLESLGMRVLRSGGEQIVRPAPFNLLLTRRWMMLVPRTRECVDGVSINALGFAGSLFVRDEAQLRVIETRGPMTLLIEASQPRIR